MKALQRFKDCELQVLVATDIAARGLDIESLPHVVNYDLPHVPEDYVHRIGRTGRAGESGQAVSLVSGEDRTLFRDIERLIGKKIEQQIIPGFEPGSGYHSAQPEPQGRADNSARASSADNNATTSRAITSSARASSTITSSARASSTITSNARASSAITSNARASGRGLSPPHLRRGGAQRRGGPRETRSPSGAARTTALPSEKVQQSVRQEQLEYHRHQQQAEEHRKEPAPANEPAPAKVRAKDKAVPALFGVVGRR